MVPVIAVFLRITRRRLRGAVLLLAALVALAGDPARAEGRVALVIGNAGYTALQPLANPVNDAKGIAAALERIGFEVTLVTDAPHDRLAPVVDAFAARAESAETVLFYYSGHAFQQNGRNLLVPADAALGAPEAFEAETWSFSDDIVARLSGEGRQTLFFLDACRTNPLPLSLRGAVGDGLAKPDTGTGSFVAFATQPGAVARDGLGVNSPFTLAMLKHMETPGISISDLMIAVRNEVVAETRETQVPWDQSSLRAQFYFVPVEEAGDELTEADLDAIGGLDEESIRNVIGALADNGVTLEILVVEDEPTEVADATPNPIVAIDEVEDPNQAATDPETGTGDEDTQVAMLDDTRSVGDDAPDDTGEATLADKVAAAEAVVAAAAARASTGPTEADLAAVELPGDLPLAIQQELSRTGCHRAVVDGIWGKVSRISLLRYYTAKGKVTAEEARAEPTELAYRRLALEPGVVCEGVVAAPVRTASASTGSKRTVVQKAAAPAAATTAPKTTTPRISSKPTTSSSGTRVPPKINRAKPGVFR
ncbi:caspase family protein [Vannielia litorea]|uniref:Caspase domain-containing protein n=1 Tax=Vannielia litorea TaxID=1217970 RepID=A0A1N6EP64_9RHOB|nr:caspase family protein [Vannielia litorea]SIN84794.1 Caspase domain-containing protein [Vannielia litorea]